MSPALSSALKIAFQAHQSGAFQDVVLALKDHMNECVAVQPAGILITNALLRNKQIDLAEKLAKAILNRRADDLEICKILALIHQQRGELKDLERILRYIIVLDPRDAGSCLKLASNQTSEAREKNGRVLLWVYYANSANPGVLCAIANQDETSHYKINHLRIARQAVLLNPSDKTSMTCFINVLVRNPMILESLITWSQRVFTSDPQNEALLLDIVTCLKDAKRSDLALKELRKGYARLSTSQSIKTELISTLFYCGQFDQLSELFDLPKENSDAGFDVDAQAIALTSAGHRTAAVELLKSHLNSHSSINLYRRLAWILFDTYEFALAEDYSETLAKNSSHPSETETYRAFLELGTGNADAADLHFAEAARLIQPDLINNYRLSQSDMMRVSPKFHSDLSVIDFATLAPVQLVGRRSKARSRIFLTVDQNYLDRFRDSIVDNANKTRGLIVHLHVVCPSSIETLALLNANDKIIVSYEEPDLEGWSEPERRAYFSSIRFVRAWQLLANNEVHKIALVDVDTEWHDAISDIFHLAGPEPLSLIHVPSAPPWAKYNATCGIYGSDANALEFLRHVAQYIWWFLENRMARWRLDQCALYCSLLHFQRDRKINLDIRDLSALLSSVLLDTRGEQDRTTIVARSRTRAELIRPVKDLLEKLGGRDQDVGNLMAMELAYAPEDAELRERVARHKLASGDLQGFLDILPSKAAHFWDDAQRNDLKNSQKFLQQFVDLNRRFLVERATRHVPHPAPVSDNKLFASIATNLKQSSLEDDPFTYTALKSVLPDEMYADMARHVSRLPVTWGHNSFYKDRGAISRSDLVQDKNWLEFAEILDGQEFLDWVIWKLRAGEIADFLRNSGFELRPDFRISIDRRNYSLGPHKDHPNRFATGLFYLPLDSYSEDLGTCIYRRNDSEWILDNGLHGDLKEFETIRKIPYSPNSGIIFLNMGNAYHGVEVVANDARRTLLQYTIRLVPAGS